MPAGPKNPGTVALMAPTPHDPSRDNGLEHRLEQGRGHGRDPSRDDARQAELRQLTGRLSRRRFLGRSASVGARAIAGSAAARLALPVIGTASTLAAACGGTSAVAPTIVPLFSPDRVLVAGRPQRIPFAIVAPDPEADGSPVALPSDDSALAVTVLHDSETVLETAVSGRVVEHDHVGEPDPNHQHANLFRYYPLRATLPETGIYDLRIAVGDTVAELAIQCFDEAEVAVPLVGDPFPVISTPTVDEPDGVDRLCTRIEPCPFHDISAADVVGTGRPVALLVATPAFCSTAYCGPVLDTLIDESGGHPDVAFVHVEVYANPDEVDGNYLDPGIRLAPAVTALRLGFEPSLFLVAGDGTLVDRIDNVFDRTELGDALSGLVA